MGADPHNTSTGRKSVMETRRDQMFPTLQPPEIARMQRFGKIRTYKAGEQLVRTGEAGLGLTIILAGHVDMTQHTQSGEGIPITTHGPGGFMGELAQLGGRPSLVDGFAHDAVEAL